MSDSSIKTLTLKGNLKDNYISVRLYPINDFSQGRWNMCVTQLIYHLKNDVEIKNVTQSVKEICGVSSNFVKGTKFNSSNELETIYQNLNLFLLQGLKNDKRQVNFDKTWSLINNFSEEIKLYISDLTEKSQTFSLIDSDFYIIVLLQRIK
jgi:hypothetical protein